MFKLLVSNTSVNLSIAFELLGPGIFVLTIGPLGSPANSASAEGERFEEICGEILEVKGVELDTEEEGATAAAVA